MEQVYYEAKPYLWLVAAVYAFSRFSQGPLAIASGIVLVLCAALVLGWRWEYRKALSRKKT